MTTFPVPPNYADHILVASPSKRVRQRVLESLRSPVRCFEQASGGAEALNHLESGNWQVLFLDRRLPDLDAEELSQTVRRRYPSIEVVLLDPEVDPSRDAEDTADRAPAAAIDGPAELGPVFDNDKSKDAVLLTSRFVLETPLPGMIGNSHVMQAVYRLVRLLAPRNTTVLITGPTGCGKELVARAIHQLSPRSARTFAVVNCAAIPETLLEAELFGYARGAFTGAAQSYAGRIQAAQGGTAVSRRNRRDAVESAAQAAALSGAEGTAAPGQRRSCAGRCPRRLSHECAPAFSGPRGKISRGFVLPYLWLPH